MREGGKGRGEGKNMKEDIYKGGNKGGKGCTSKTPVHLNAKENRKAHTETQTHKDMKDINTRHARLKVTTDA